MMHTEHKQRSCMLQHHSAPANIPSTEGGTAGQGGRWLWKKNMSPGWAPAVSHWMALRMFCAVGGRPPFWGRNEAGGRNSPTMAPSKKYQHKYVNSTKTPHTQKKRKQILKKKPQKKTGETNKNTQKTKNVVYIKIFLEEGSPLSFLEVLSPQESIFHGRPHKEFCIF